MSLGSSYGPSTWSRDHEAFNEISQPATEQGMLVRNRLTALDGKGRAHDLMGLRPRYYQRGVAWFCYALYCPFCIYQCFLFQRDEFGAPN